MIKTLNQILSLSPRIKTWLAIIYDCFSIMFCLNLSLLIRFEFSFSSVKNLPSLFAINLFFLCIQISTFYLSGLYKGIWRYSSIHDLVRLIKGVSISILITGITIFFFNRLTNVPRSLFLIDWLLLVICLGGGRLAYRIFRDQLINIHSSGETSKVIIVGAGSAGEQLFREIRKNPVLNMKIVSFVDDDSSKRGRLLHNVPVLGCVKDLPAIIKRTGAQQIFIAIPSASSVQMRTIINSISGTGVKFKTLPGLEEILTNKVGFSQLRDVNPEDLLGRDSVTLDTKSVSTMIEDNVILVTGAGGSIGSELCKQISKFKPKSLVLFENSEYNLYTLGQELSATFPTLKFINIIGDVKNLERVRSVFFTYKPQVVFHAAAYKHVPMMEDNCYESIQTNILGTKTVATVAIEQKVDRFVLISSDKAINPTNMMGATKRASELVCQKAQLENQSKTKFMIVRFGNVLGSSGSVIPLFKRQIANGGPITVTHENIVRYFMSIPEATQLVLQAGAIGAGGEIFVLEMGEPIKILDLAKQMIKLSGLEPNKDIEINISGLRPGEKLFEELLANDENTIPTVHPKLRIAKASSPDKTKLNLIDEIILIPPSCEKNTIKLMLKEIIPEYSPYIEKNNEREDPFVEKDTKRSLH